MNTSTVWEFFNASTIQLIIFFVAPGFISLKIWGLIYPSQRLRLSESLIEAIIFSSFNYIITFGLYFLVKDTSFFWVCYLVVVILAFLYPVLLKRILNSTFLQRRIINPMPKPWDYFFSKRECCFMLIHLNNGRMIGGFYGPDSFASSYPEKEDLYLQEAWRIDTEGKFNEKISGSKGLLINHDVIEYIELFDTKGENNE